MEAQHREVSASEVKEDVQIFANPIVDSDSEHSPTVDVERINATKDAEENGKIFNPLGHHDE